MKNKHIFIPLFVFFGAGVVSLIASIVDFTAVNKQLSYSSEMIQFNYDGASDGFDPDGNPFDAVNFMTDDVIEGALAASNLTGEKYAIENVKQYIAIENVVPKGITKEINSYTSLVSGNATNTITSKDYHPVRYRFIVYQDLDKGLSEKALKEFTNNLVQEYRAKFTSTFQKSFEKETYDELLAFSSYDYQYQAEILANKVHLVASYAAELHAKHEEFESDGQTFNNIIARCNDLSTVVNDINDIITYYSISKDPSKLKDYYDYKLKELGYEKDKYDDDLNNITTQINNYHKDDTTYVGSGETVIEISSNSGETYDALLARKIEVENALANVNTQIAYYTELRARVDAVTASDKANVEARITAIENSYNAIADDFQKLLTAYNQKYIGPKAVAYSKTTYSSASLFSSAFIVRAIKIAAPIMLTVMLGIAIYYLSREIRKQKKAA